MFKVKKKKTIKIFILVGEDSGDFIASIIIKKLVENKKYNFIFHAVYGPRMSKYVSTKIFHYKEIGYLGFKDVLQNFFKLRKKINFLVNYIYEFNPHLVITIDAKLFSLNLAKSLKKKFLNTSSKILHIVPPTIWAHSPKRALKWRGVHNSLISLFPNEQKYFDEFSIKTTYLGNPFFEKIAKNKILKNKFNGDICILLPGSRKKEIIFNLDVLLNSVNEINKRFKKLKWYLPTLNANKTYIISKLNEYKLQNCIKLINFDKDIRYIQNAKVAIACSGTVTFELALAGVPTIAIYKTDWLSAMIGKKIVNMKNVVLPNFIMEKQIIPFLFQNECTAEKILNLFSEFYIQNKIYKKKFKLYSEKLVRKMGYKNSKQKLFSENINKKIIKMVS